MCDNELLNFAVDFDCFDNIQGTENTHATKDANQKGNKRRKAQTLAQRIANVDDVVKQVHALSQQLKDLQESAYNIKQLYEQEKRERQKYENLAEELEKKLAELDELVNVKDLQVEEYRLLYESKDTTQYDELVQRHIKICLKSEEVLHYRDHCFLEKLHKYCMKKGIVIPEVSNSKPGKKNCRKKVITHHKASQCDIVSCKKTCEKETQYISTVTTRGTNTEKNSNYRAINNIIDEMIYLKKPTFTALKPLFDDSEPEVVNITIGTCTDLCNVQKSIDYVSSITTIKTSDSRPPSRNIKISNSPSSSRRNSLCDELYHNKRAEICKEYIQNIKPQIVQELYCLFGRMITNLFANNDYEVNYIQAQNLIYKSKLYEAFKINEDLSKVTNTINETLINQQNTENLTIEKLNLASKGIAFVNMEGIEKKVNLKRKFHEMNNLEEEETKERNEPNTTEKDAPFRVVVKNTKTHKIIKLVSKLSSITKGDDNEESINDNNDVSHVQPKDVNMKGTEENSSLNNYCNMSDEYGNSTDNDEIVFIVNQNKNLNNKKLLNHSENEPSKCLKHYTIKENVEQQVKRKTSVIPLMNEENIENEVMDIDDQIKVVVNQKSNNLNKKKIVDKKKSPTQQKQLFNHRENLKNINRPSKTCTKYVRKKKSCENKNQTKPEKNTVQQKIETTNKNDEIILMNNQGSSTLSKINIPKNEKSTIQQKQLINPTYSNIMFQSANIYKNPFNTLKNNESKSKENPPLSIINNKDLGYVNKLELNRTTSDLIANTVQQKAECVDINKHKEILINPSVKNILEPQWERLLNNKIERNVNDLQLNERISTSIDTTPINFDSEEDVKNRIIREQDVNQLEFDTEIKSLDNMSKDKSLVCLRSDNQMEDNIEIQGNREVSTAIEYDNESMDEDDEIGCLFNPTLNSFHKDGKSPVKIINVQLINQTEKSENDQTSINVTNMDNLEAPLVVNAVDEEKNSLDEFCFNSFIETLDDVDCDMKIENSKTPTITNDNVNLMLDDEYSLSSMLIIEEENDNLIIEEENDSPELIINDNENSMESINHENIFIERQSPESPTEMIESEDIIFETIEIPLDRINTIDPKSSSNNCIYDLLKTHYLLKNTKTTFTHNVKLKIALQNYFNNAKYDIENLRDYFDDRQFIHEIIELLINIKRTNEHFNGIELIIPPEHKRLMLILMEKPALGLALLEEVEQKLFNFPDINKLKLNGILNLTQLYLLLSQPLQPHTARLFIAKCLYFYVNLATPMIYLVLLAHPTALPHREACYDRSDPLITVIIHILMSTKYNMDNKDLFHKELLSKLRFQYHHTPFEPTQQAVITNLMQKLLAGKVNELTYAFAILCKRKNYKTVLNDVLQSQLLPVANELYNSTNESNKEKTIAVLDCMSIIIKPFPIEIDVSSYMSLFQSFYQMPYGDVKNAAIRAVLRLQRFGAINCLNALLSLKMVFSDLEKETLLMLKSFLYRKPLHIWQNICPDINLKPIT